MILTEPIGSIPRTKELMDAFPLVQSGNMNVKNLRTLYNKAVEDTIKRFVDTKSQVITDGEQTKPSYVTYPVAGLKNVSPDGIVLKFEDGHGRRLPKLEHGPFRYKTYAVNYLMAAKGFTDIPLKQAVTSASSLSLIYPNNGIDGYSKADFVHDAISEVEKDIRYCIEEGTHTVQVDFAEAALAFKLDPSGELFNYFIELNNRVFERFSPIDLKKIGVHVCQDPDVNSVLCNENEYLSIFKKLFDLKVDKFYIALKHCREKMRILSEIRKYMRETNLIYIGVIDVCSKEYQQPKDVCHFISELTKYIPVEKLGITDDCGFAPYADDNRTSRDFAFSLIKARNLGAEMAASCLGI